jgi:NAD(P)-dependent dehydrogenase (short-subunit alcohol dehydrogenase family)
MGATVVITSRSKQRAANAANLLSAEVAANPSSAGTTIGNLVPMGLDLANLTDVKRFADAYCSQFGTLNYFVQNAGIVSFMGELKNWTSPQGFEIV